MASTNRLLPNRYMDPPYAPNLEYNLSFTPKIPITFPPSTNQNKNQQPVQNKKQQPNQNRNQQPVQNNISQPVQNQITQQPVSSTDSFDLNSYFDKIRGNTDSLARDIEETERANAESEYNAIMDSLRSKKDEVYRLADTQRKNIDEELKLGKDELADKEQTELRKIENEKQGFIQSNEEQKDSLARQWRDTSLQVQKIMRARGAADSSYTAGEEAKLLMDFNRGLNTLAQKAQSVLANFVDAAQETVKFYQRQQAKLESQARQSKQEIDNWVRSRIEEIQNQEKMALSDKLKAIRSAILQAKTLKTNVENQIANQQLSLATYINQIQQNYKNAVAAAAKGSLSEASKGIQDTSKMFKLISTIIDNGGQFVEKVDKDGKKLYFVVGVSPDTDEYVEIPVSPAYVNIKSIEMGNKIKNMMPDIEAAKMKSNDFINLGSQSLGLSSSPFSTTQPENKQTNRGGIFGAISKFFGK